jgi:hypothetical protein
VQKSKTSNANNSNIVFFLINRKNQHESHRKRIYPSASLDCQLTAQEVTTRFSSTALPMNSKLMIIALRNLVKYLQENNLPQPRQQINLHKSHRVFHRAASPAQRNNLHRPQHLLQHPSSFKMQVRHDGLSLFNMLNQCSSSVGFKS